MIAPLTQRTLAFIGGGTGGHVFPAVALARALPSFSCVFLVPKGRGDEVRIAGEFRCVPLAVPRPDEGMLLYPARLARAALEARRVLRSLGARAVVGLGGYGSVPGCLAARTLSLPLYLMECNAVAGRATRLLARLARGVGLGHDAAAGNLPRGVASRVTGTPLRAGLSSRASAEEFGLNPSLPTLLILGGSQGAATLNSRVLEAIPACKGMPFQILHCAGEADAARVRAAYAALGFPARVVDFLHDIGRAYSVADLVLARGGASTVAECTALRRPAIYVPYPWHRDRQQGRNAAAAVKAGAALIVEESDLNSAAFRTLMEGLLLRREERARMARAAGALARPDAAAAMAAHLIETLGEAFADAAWITEIGG